VTLLQFVQHYEKQPKYMREIESQNDYNSRGKPKLQILNDEILMHVASMYTCAIFKMFNEPTFGKQYLKSIRKYFEKSLH